MDKEKKYSEADVVSIIQQAIRDDRESIMDDHHSDQNSTQSDGLMLPEIEKIAAEVGISPEHVRKAAAKLDMQKKLDPHQPTESGEEAFAQRLIPGSFNEIDIENLMMSLKGKASRPKEPLTLMDDYDEIKKAGSTYEYVFKGIRSTATLTEGGCRLNIYYPHQFEGTYGESGLLSGGVAIVFSIITLGILKQGFEMDIGILHALMMSAVIFPFAFGVIRFIQKGGRHQTELKAEKLADEAERLLMASSKKPVLSPQNSAPQKEGQIESATDRRKAR